MVASRSARQRKPAADAGSLAKVKIDPGAEAPCLTYLPEAQGRLHERREQRGADR